MTIALKARAAVRLAREIAEIIPFPPGGGRADPQMYWAWENLMLDAARGLAAQVGNDLRVLDTAVGPKLEVGVNPPWRVLLILAQTHCEARVETFAGPADLAASALG